MSRLTQRLHHVGIILISPAAGDVEFHIPKSVFIHAAKIRDFDNISKSFPDFLSLLRWREEEMKKIIMIKVILVKI
jgi:hypothetical protein